MFQKPLQRISFGIGNEKKFKAKHIMIKFHSDDFGVRSPDEYAASISDKMLLEPLDILKSFMSFLLLSIGFMMTFFLGFYLNIKYFLNIKIKFVTNNF